MSIVIYFNIRTHIKRLTYTMRIERPLNKRFDEMMKQRKRELQSSINAKQNGPGEVAAGDQLHNPRAVHDVPERELHGQLRLH